MSAIKVLLTEDSPTVLAFFRTLLESEGFEVIMAENGLEAIGKFYQTIPDVVVSDVEMPIMNGYHFCRFLRNEEETRGVPFVLLTALTEGLWEYWGHEIGADRYMRKDESSETLPATVRELAAQSNYDRATVAKLGVKYANPFHILDRLNRMLDRELLRMTLTSKITSLAFKDVTLNELSRELLDTLLKIIRVESAVAVILNTEEIHVYFHAPQPMDNAYFEEFHGHYMQFLQDKSSFNLESSDFSVECFAEMTEEPVPFRPDEVKPFFRRLSDEAQMALFLAPCPDVPLQRDSLELVESLMDYLSISMGHTFVQQKLKNLSVIDSLTHLYNRRHFMNLLEAEYRRTIRHNLNLTVIFMDLDNFKKINDTYGHLSGDIVLKSLAETIGAAIRTSDVAGRYGGEEFVIYLPETNLENAFMTAERLRKTWEARSIAVNKDVVIRVTMSLGVASITEVDPSRGVEGMLDLADQKLYQAKQSGKNRVVK